MPRDIDRRLKVLEAHAAQAMKEQGYMTLAQWHTYYETGELPDAPGVSQWHEQAQARWQDVVATLAMYDDEFGHKHFEGVPKGDAMPAATHIASPLSRTYPVSSCGHFYTDIISQATATFQKGNPLSSPIKNRSLLDRHELP